MPDLATRDDDPVLAHDRPDTTGAPAMPHPAAEPSTDTVRAVVAAFDHETVAAVAHALHVQAAAMTAHAARHHHPSVEDDSHRVAAAAAAFEQAASVGHFIRDV